MVMAVVSDGVMVMVMVMMVMLMVMVVMVMVMMMVMVVMVMVVMVMVVMVMVSGDGDGIVMVMMVMMVMVMVVVMVVIVMVMVVMVVMVMVVMVVVSGDGGDGDGDDGDGGDGGDGGDDGGDGDGDGDGKMVLTSRSFQVAGLTSLGMPRQLSFLRSSTRHHAVTTISHRRTHENCYRHDVVMMKVAILNDHAKYCVHRACYHRGRADREITVPKLTVIAVVSFKNFLSLLASGSWSVSSSWLITAVVVSPSAINADDFISDSGARCG